MEADQNRSLTSDAQIRFSTLFSVPTLIVSRERLKENPEYFVSTFIYSLQGYPFDDSTIKVHLFDALELYLRRMISRCAIKVYLPSYSKPSWLKPAQMKSTLAPSTRKHLVFLDQRQKVWNAIKAYFEPIRAKHKTDNVGPAYDILDLVAWDLYCLALSVKYSSEAVLSHEKTIQAIDWLEHKAWFGSEEKSRLARVRGIFGLFTNKEEVPGFRVLPTVFRHCILERIEEILEDAYLLEVSELRRLFSVSVNRAAAKRQLRKITDFIVGHRSWAKGILETGSQLIFPSSGEPLEKLGNLFQGLIDFGVSRSDFKPVLLKPDQSLYSTVKPSEEYLIQAHRSVATRDTFDWIVKLSGL